MNKAARLIAQAVVREDYRYVILGGRKYRMYAPVIRDICRMFDGTVEMPKNPSRMEVLWAMVTYRDEICRVMSVAVTLRGRAARCRRSIALRHIRRKATVGELYAACKVLGIQTNGNEFFAFCRLSKSKEKSDIRLLGNNNIIGQIGTFIENLGLTYQEVVEKIPYRNLLMLSADKLRYEYPKAGEKTVETLSGKDMLARKRGI